MKKLLSLLALAVGIASSHAAMAQAPAGAPAGATGICKDGTYSTAASKSGACGGHKGVQTWYAAAPAKPVTPAAAPAAAATAATPAAAASVKKTGPAAAAAARAQAPGGGPGLVWVNTSSNVYHCPGSTFYGKTKAGSYMSEADAKGKGAHADHGQTCSK
jgi:hypothetical protein